MSKGSKRRPSQVDQKTLDENWERVFGKGREVPARAGEGTQDTEGASKEGTEPSRSGAGRAVQP